MDIQALDGAGGAPRSTEARGLTAMKSEDFLKILVTEMQNQDPFEPGKTSDMIAQVSQIRSIEQSARLNNALDLLTRQQRIGGASELIGKFVQAISLAADGSATYHEGVVTGIRFSDDGQAVLELDSGEAVPATDVVRVTSLSVGEQAAAGAGTAVEADGDKSGASERRRDRSWFDLGGSLHV